MLEPESTVRPSSKFSSVVESVAPSKIPSSVSDTFTAPIPISPVNVGFAMSASDSFYIS